MPDMMRLMATGIRENTHLPLAAVQKLTGSIAGMFAETQTLALTADTSALKWYEPQELIQSITADVDAAAADRDTDILTELTDFYREYVQPTLDQIAEDARRQADKDEHPVVQIGNRTVNDAVETQRRANGFQFTK